MTTQDERLAELHEWGQSHLLAHWERLNPRERENLVSQIEQIDIPYVLAQAKATDSAENLTEAIRKAEPPRAMRLDDANPEFSREAARVAGEAALADGKVGVVLVAGGQGTRLGFPRAKGLFPIGPVSGATLFQILLEKVRAVAQRYGVSVPLLVMTSSATHDETEKYLQQTARFGLPPEDVLLFRQGNLPAVGLADHRLLLDGPDRLALVPDGHGGLLPALSAAGLLDEMVHRGIEHLFYMQVDNPLVGVCDPTFVGAHLLAGSELSTQAVAKTGPDEAVGNIVAIDGKLRIVEYSELTQFPEVAAATDPTGRLRLWAGNIAVHLFSVAFLRRMAAAADDALPLHRAEKKVPYVDENGERIEPTAANAYKFERFIFDLLPHSKNPLVMEVRREERFAPVKKSSDLSDSDTPETARALLLAEHRRWLAAAGAEVLDGAAVEISPLYALGPEDLVGKLQPGLKFDGDAYLV